MRAKCKTPKKLTRQELISQAEVCKRLGISIRTLKRWRTSGEIGHYDFRGTIKFDAREIEAYKRGHRIGPSLVPNLHLFPLPSIIVDRDDAVAVCTSSESGKSTDSENGGQS